MFPGGMCPRAAGHQDLQLRPRVVLSGGIIINRVSVSASEIAGRCRQGDLCGNLLSTSACSTDGIRGRTGGF